MKAILMQGLGYGFVLLGIAGLVLPFLQGILFILIGLAILSRHARWAEELIARLKRRHPRLERAIDAAETQAQAWWDRVTGLFRR
jgi:uncharacterized membrane protein YbaN (DUF454 family)